MFDIIESNKASLSKGSLTDDEKSITKNLLSRKWRNQNIQYLLNKGRKATVNSARITEVKQDSSIVTASDDDADFFILKKEAYDYITGLNKYDDERLIRAREAMILAVQIFNNPSIKFKTEQFSVSAIIAWNYLLQEIFTRKGISIKKSNGQYSSLSEMIKNDQFSLSDGIRNNIESIIKIRNAVCHGDLGDADQCFFEKLQDPGNTNKNWCLYHKAHKDYTYSEDWIQFIIKEISTDKGYNKIIFYTSPPCNKETAPAKENALPEQAM